MSRRYLRRVGRVDALHPRCYSSQLAFRHLGFWLWVLGFLCAFVPWWFIPENYFDVLSPNRSGISASMYATVAITATFCESSVGFTLSRVSACVW